MRNLKFLFILYFLEATPISPGLNSWFSASKLSYAGGGSLFVSPNSRTSNPASFSQNRSFATSFVFYPAGIQAQSVSIFSPKKTQLTTVAINHISYGAFKGYNEDAIPTENYNSNETWLRFDFSNLLKNYPIRYGLSSQLYFSKLGDYYFTKLYFSSGIIWSLNKYKASIGFSVDDFSLDIRSNIKTSQNPPLRYSFGIRKELKYLPLKISIDYLSIGENNEDYFISGIFSISNKINLSWGTSTRKFSQNTNENILRTIMGSTGLGISIMKDDFIINYGLYYYGTGGLTNGIDLIIKF